MKAPSYTPQKKSILELLEILRVLPDTIKEGIIADSHRDVIKIDGVRKLENGYNPDVTIHRVYAAVDVSGELCRVKVTLKHDRRDDQMQKAYSYEAIKIELLDYMKKENRVVDGQNRATETAPRISTNSISVAKLLKDVEKSYVKGEKLLNVSQVLTEGGRPLVVEHATNADFTVFDMSHIGENSKDNGIFGAGFYFGTHAPGWMQGAKNIMKVYLDIKHPFEVTDDVVDIYTEIREKMDTPAMRSLVVKGFNDHEEHLGVLIDQIKYVDDLIKNHPNEVQEMMLKDEELEYVRPDDRLRVWREHEIMNRSGLGSLALSWQSFIYDQIGSHKFTAAAIQDGYDGVIVDRGNDYKEYVVFEGVAERPCRCNSIL